MASKIQQAPAEYRHTAVSVDTVLFSVMRGTLCTLLVHVDRPPHYVKMKGFPGGLVYLEETAEDAVRRSLTEKVGTADFYFEQLYTFTDIERDKRNRVVSIAFLGLVPEQVALEMERGKGVWIPVKEVEKLAYDHNSMLDVAQTRLAGKLLYTNIARHLLPKKFTLTELQKVYETVCGEEFDKRNFRKKILSLDILKDTGELQTGVANRPASLYSFTGSRVTEIPLIPMK